MSTRASSRYDAIILGAGGAGMMCALTAGQRGRKILLIDHADEPGKKILISVAAAAISPISTCCPSGICQPTRTSPSRRCDAFARKTLSPWSSAITSLGMRNRWGSFSATARPGRSLPCCSRNAPRDTSS